MVYIVDGGVVYELTRAQYKKLLRQVATGEEYSIGNYGKFMGHTTNVVGLTPTQAEDRLRKLGAM